MAKSPTERITELALFVATLAERLDRRGQDVDELRQDVPRLWDDLAVVRLQLAVLRQEHNELVKRLDERNRNRWAIIALFIGCLLTFGANLLLAFLKR